MDILTMEDANYLAQQSSGKINMIVSGMTALMNETDNKVATMESQNWFQRMVKTVSGKNKLTKSEIQQNHDKLNAYMSEAIAELYNRNCIDHEVMISLGTQLNEIYADHLQLKDMLGQFVGKLNKKIDSVDNFHMLNTEIEQGVYLKYSPLIAICKVISQFDNRILENDRKLDIITRSLETQGIINSNEIVLSEYLMNILEVPREDMGQVYLELGTIRGNFIADIILNMMEKYHFLPDMARKMKNKDRLIDELIFEKNLEKSITLSTSEIYDDFIKSKIDIRNSLIPIEAVKQIEAKETVEVESTLEKEENDIRLEKAERLFIDYKLEEAFELFETLAEEGNPRAMYFMGVYYEKGYTPVVKDKELSEGWWQKGCDLGDVLATFKSIYSYGIDSNEYSEFINRVIKSLRELAEADDIFAQYEIGELYKDGIGIKYGIEENRETAMEWYEKSALGRYWISMNKLGCRYYEDNYYSEAIKWYSEAAKIGYFISQYNLANMFMAGECVNKDKLQAKIWYEKAAKQGYPDAEYELGDYYYIYMDDDEKAFKWYMESAKHGLAIGEYKVAQCYKIGQGIEKNIEKAKIWYKKASDKNYNKATHKLADCMYREKNYIRGRELYLKAAKNGYPDAENVIGVIYLTGDGVEKNREIAFEWFMKAAEQEDAIGEANVAYCYYMGHGVEKNDNKAKEWYRKSAKQGYEDADKSLYEYYGEITERKKIELQFLDDVKKLCEIYIEEQPEYSKSKFDIKYSIKRELGISKCKEIYLAHDATIFQSGKNGFAITCDGIYSREMGFKKVHYTTFKDISKMIEIKNSGLCIYGDNKMLAYIDIIDKNKLIKLFEDIQNLYLNYYE